MMDEPNDRHPAEDLLAGLMDLVGLSFGLDFLSIAASAVRL
jgi:hypothetical protein